MKQNDKYLFFWKHRLSQWHMVNFLVKGVTFSCCEQYMMAEKAKLFSDQASYKKIMEADHPRNHQKLGREVKNYDQATWDAKKYQIVVAGNYARFSQSRSCFDILRDTYPKILCEASPTDCVWGCGLGASNPDIWDETKWRGQNLLGKALMEVREALCKHI